MELLIYNPALELIGILDTASDIIWHRVYSTAGDFEVHASVTDLSLDLLKTQNIVTKLDTVEFGFIEAITIEQTEEGETIKASGRFGSSLLGRRIIFDETTLNSTVELAMRNLVSQAAITPTNPDRLIPALQLGNLNSYPETVNLQVTYKNLLSTLRDLSETSGIGYRCRFDPSTKKIVFETFKALDRSALQSTNPKCLFSTDFDTLMSSNYAISEEDKTNVALVGGEGQGIDRKLVIVGSVSGSERREVFVNAKDQRKDELNLVEYEQLLAQKGSLVLNNQIEHFEGEVIADGNLKYKTDYDLGDIVTIENTKWGKQIHVRITEITEVYDQNGSSIIPVFGKSRNTRSNIQDTSGSESSEVVALTPNRVVITDNAGLLSTSTITSQELIGFAGIQAALQTQINNLWKTIYPIGSLYLSTVATNPETLFGGTWEQIQDKFMLAAGTTYPAGTTGGNASHVHTSAAHTHSVAAHSHDSAAHTHTVNAHRWECEPCPYFSGSYPFS
ncbi:MAG: siphovirus ReqiPepy6 Gp37-like family protein, partial [Erysipelotrichaceae bacterium]